MKRHAPGLWNKKARDISYDLFFLFHRACLFLHLGSLFPLSSQLITRDMIGKSSAEKKSMKSPNEAPVRTGKGIGLTAAQTKDEEERKCSG